MSQNGKGSSYHSRTNGNTPSKPWEIEHFPVLALFFYLSFSNVWRALPDKNFIFKLTRIDLLAHNVYSSKIKSCSLWKHLKLGVFWFLFLYNN